MIEACKSAPFEWLFSRYNRIYLLRRHFCGFGLHGSLDGAPTGRPLLYMMNHSSWWDGLAVYHAVRSASNGDHYLMMDERQLGRYRFFRRIGAFSIDKTSRRGVLQSLEYAAALLKEGKRVWVFPQGDIVHPERGPLEFQTGVGRILAECPEAAAVPVTMVYSFCMRQKPEASMRVGERVDGEWNRWGRKESTERLRDVMEGQLALHRRQTSLGRCGEAEGYVPLLKSGRSTDEAYDAFRRRVSRWRPFSGS